MSDPQPHTAYLTRAAPGHSRHCQCGGTGRWFTTRGTDAGEIVTGYQPCTARQLFKQDENDRRWAIQQTRTDVVLGRDLR